MKTHEIIAKVYDKYRGLPVRMSELWKKSPEWYRSLARLPRSEDAYGTGNVDLIIEKYCDHVLNDFGGASPEAALYLADLVHEKIRERLLDLISSPLSQQQLRRCANKESTDAICAFDECDLAKASDNDLSRWISEFREANDSNDACISKIRAEQLMRTAKARKSAASTAHNRHERVN